MNKKKVATVLALLRDLKKEAEAERDRYLDAINRIEEIYYDDEY